MCWRGPNSGKILYGRSFVCCCFICLLIFLVLLPCLGFLTMGKINFGITVNWSLIFTDSTGWQNVPTLGFRTSLCTDSGGKGLSAAGRAEKELTGCCGTHKPAQSVPTSLSHQLYFLPFLPAYLSPHPLQESLFTGYFGAVLLSFFVSLR